MSAAKRRGGMWSSWRDASGPKPKAPEHGIKIRTVGTTWWGQKWIGALEKISDEYASRLARGKTYARTGRVHDLLIAGGRVTVRVQGSRPAAYRITITVPVLDDATWTSAIALLSSKARFSAELLAGDMPKDVDDAFAGSGASLFPRDATELTTTCSCPDWANPCKHVAAAHYVLGDAFDRDPFLLFELRGRTRDDVLAATKRARGGVPSVSAAESAGTMLEKVGDADYDTWRRTPPSLTLPFTVPSRTATVIAALGAPGSWREKIPPIELLSQMVHSASIHARQLALSSGPEKTGVSDDRETKAKRLRT